jgi:phosphatidylglycerol lysyltransferase
LRVAAIVARIENTVAALALLGDKSVMMGQEGDGFLMYGVSGRSWVAMGDPVGPDATRRELAWRFVEAADEHGAWPVFYEVSARHLPLYIDLGLTLLKVGEEAIVPLGSFSLDGAARKGLRRTRRTERPAPFAMVDRAEVPSIPGAAGDLRRMAGVEIRAEKGLPDGRRAISAHFRMPSFASIADRWFANVWTGNGRELSIDMMRYRRDAPHGVMEYLVWRLCSGAPNGLAQSLGMAPLSGLRSAMAPL